jgi:carboxymethylenebutenolidase
MTSAPIETSSVVVASEGARNLDSHFALPASGKGPGLLIFSEMWGVSPKKREMADDYARQGWCAMAPNIFWRSEFTGLVPFDNADLAWKRLQAFDWEKTVDDCRAAAAWLRAQPQCNGKIAGIGFCMGGRIAFLGAARAGLNAGIGLYALGIAKHLDEVRSMTVPMQLHYGLSDEHIPKSEIDAVSAAAAGNDKVEIQLYAGAGHGFFNRTNSPDDIKAVEAASAHIARFLAAFA